MEKIKVEKGRVKVEINPNIYSYDSVVRTSKTLKKACNVKIKKSDEAIFVTIKPRTKGIPLEVLGYEFYNYLLNTVKEMKVEE